MTMPSLPALGATSWYTYAQGLDAAARGAVPSSGDSSIAGTKTFTGTLRVGASATPPQIIEYPTGYPGAPTFQFRDHVYVNKRLGVGTEAAPRIPFAVTQVIDGSTLTTDGLGNKVGSQLNVIFQGGFSAEAGYGAPDPGFLFGANDFFLTGTSAGAVAGVSDFWGRLSEVHLRTPGASINNTYGLIGESNIDASAVGASITGWMVSIKGGAPVNNAGITVANAATLHLSSPAPSAATNAYTIYANGTGANFFGGKITADNGLQVNGGLGGFKVNAATLNDQGAAVGVYAGVNSGDPAVELANGTSNWRIDNSVGTLRFLRAGVSSDMELSSGGHLKTKGGVGFFNTAAITTKPTVTGSRGGNAALASLLTTLASTGLLTDSTTA